MALAWITLLVVVLRETVPVELVLAAALLAVAIYGGATAVERWGPQPAVVVEACPTPAAELPAGTEVWVHPVAGGWRITGDPGFVCPPEAVALVFPAR